MNDIAVVEEEEDGEAMAVFGNRVGEGRNDEVIRGQSDGGGCAGWR